MSLLQERKPSIRQRHWRLRRVLGLILAALLCLMPAVHAAQGQGSGLNALHAAAIAQDGDTEHGHHHHETESGAPSLGGSQDQSDAHEHSGIDHVHETAPEPVRVTFGFVPWPGQAAPRCPCQPTRAYRIADGLERPPRVA